MTPGYGVNILIPHNGVAPNPATHTFPTAITHAVSSGGSPVLTPPTFTVPKAIGLLEKITPPNVNATQGIQNAQSKVRAAISRWQQRAKNVSIGYAKAVTMRR